MAVIESTQTIRLAIWEDGSVRIAGSRVTPDSIIHNYKLAETQEEIAESFPSISLADINAKPAQHGR